MWGTSGINLTMCEGDFGIELPITVSGAELGANDSIKIVFKKTRNGDVILEKTFDGITDNTVNLEFTEEESELFRVGSFVYSIDWYQNGDFLCNVIPIASFKVVDKA